MLRRLCLLIALLLTCPAWAQNAAIHKDRFDATKPHALAYSRSEEPDWVPALLQKLHHKLAPSAKLQEYALLRWRDQPAWLAMVLDSPNYGHKLTLFKITGPGEAVAKLDITEDYLGIIEPTGTDGFGDGTPMLAVSIDCGGSFWACSSVATLHLDERVQDATPMETIPIGFSRDGHFLITTEDQWSGNPFPVGSNFVITVQFPRRWNGHRYVNACDEMPELYQSAGLSKNQRDEDHMGYFAYDYLSQALRLLQRGLPGQAKIIYEELIAKAPGKEYYSAEGMKELRDFYDPIFLKPHNGRPCPLAPGKSSWRRKVHSEIMRPVPPPYHP